MSETVDLAYESAVVQVVCGGQWGTGFFISDRLVVTCAHVVPSDDVTIEFAGRRLSKGRVLDRRPLHGTPEGWRLPDLAVVEAEDASENWLSLASPSQPVADGLVTVGYVRGADAIPTLTYETPVFVGMDPVDGGRLAKLANCSLLEGMSGAPLIDDATGLVVGIIKRTRSTSIGAGGWAIPIALLDAHLGRHVGPIREIQTSTAMATYVRRLAAVCDSIEPRGMRRSREATDVLFPLDDVFLSLSARNYTAADLAAVASDEPRSASDAAAAPYLMADQLADAQRQDSHPEASSSEEMGVQEILQQSCSVLLGGPGTGKSTLLQWLALNFARTTIKSAPMVEVAERQLDPSSTSDDLSVIAPSRLPLLVRLADYDAVLADGRSPGLLEHAAATAAALAGDDSGAIQQRIEELAASGGLLMLLDGMDELHDLSRRIEVRDRIAELADDLGVEGSEAAEGNLLVVTSRPAGYRDAPLPPGLFSHRMLLEMSEAAVRRFLFNWCLAVRRWGSRDGHVAADEEALFALQRSDAIAAELAERPALKRFASTPLMLTVITLVYDEGGRLPRQRVDLLREMSRLLVERRSPDIPFPDALDLLGPFALWLHENRATGLASRAEFEESVRRSYHRIGPKAEGELSRRSAIERFCVDAEQQFGLIVEKGPGVVGFQHRLLQEFFAAAEISSWSDDVFTDLRDRLGDPVWREVILFVVGLESASSAIRVSGLIERIMDDWGGEGVRADLGSGLLLAADSLGEIERSLPATEHRIVAELCASAWASAADAAGPLREEARARLGRMLATSAATVDAVLSQALVEASVLERRQIADLITDLGVALPAVTASLQALADRRNTGLAERRALMHQISLAADGTEGRVLAEERANESPLVRHLSRYGPSAALEAVEAALSGDEPGAEYAGSISGVESRLEELLASHVGAEAVLAGTAATILRPERLPSIYGTLNARGLEFEAAEVLLWAVTNEPANDIVVPEWRSIGPTYRAYVLEGAARSPGGHGNPSIAWSELELSLDAKSPPAYQQDLAGAALTFLGRFVKVVLDRHLIGVLEQVWDRWPDLRTRTEQFSSRSIAAAEVSLTASAPGPIRPRLLVLRRLEGDADSIRGEDLVVALTAAKSGSGLWRVRMERALTRPKSIGRVEPEVFAVLDELAHDPEADPSDFHRIGSFVQTIRVDSEEELEILLTRRTRHMAFGTVQMSDAAVLRLGELVEEEIPEEEIDGQASPAIAVLDDRIEAFGLLALPPGLRTSAAPAASALVEAPCRERVAVVAAVVASGVVEGGANVHIASLSDEVLFELACWIPAGTDLEAVDRVRRELEAELRSRAAFAEHEIRLAALLRLWATTTDNGLASIPGIGVDVGATVRALLLAGNHSVPWYPSAGAGGPARQPVVMLEGLTQLFISLAADVAFLRRAVGEVMVELADESCPWPPRRFMLEWLLRCTRVMPDAVSAVVGSTPASGGLVRLLVDQHSFGVRYRAFVVLCTLGELTPEMVDAVAASVSDDAVVRDETLRAASLVHSVHVSALDRLADVIGRGGLGAIAAVDVIRSIGQSYGFGLHEDLRLGLMGVLIDGAMRTSHHEVTMLPSGDVVATQSVLVGAMFELAVAGGGRGVHRPGDLFMSMRARATPADRTADRAEDFAGRFLLAVEAHLRSGGAGSV
jgi:hypothetical protein